MPLLLVSLLLLATSEEPAEPASRLRYATSAVTQLFGDA